MPFDSAPASKTLSLSQLAAILRDRSRWPDGFKWGYMLPQSCAIGLMNIVSDDEDCDILLEDAMGWGKFDEIFFSYGVQKEMDMADITPEHIAGAIEQYIVTHGDRYAVR